MFRKTKVGQLKNNSMASWNSVLTVSIILGITLINNSYAQRDSTVIDSSIQSTELPDSLNLTESDSLPVPYVLDRIITNDAFQVGEKLTFVVRYGIIKAGEATMEVEGIVPIGDREAYKVVSKARSARTFDLFFKVRDQVESWIDTRGMFSWKFNKLLREGGYKFDLLVDYDQLYGKANVKSIRYEDAEPLEIRDQNEKIIEIPPYVLDILASFYYVRTQDLELGMPLYLTNHDNEKIYDLKVIIQRREVIKVKAGKFRSIMVQPVLRGDAIFKQKGELRVWLSDDEYKIPIQMKSAVFIGKITTELKKIEGIPLPLPSQLK
jgi:hypothetical protein